MDHRLAAGAPSPRGEMGEALMDGTPWWVFVIVAAAFLGGAVLFALAVNGFLRILPGLAERVRARKRP